MRATTRDPYASDVSDGPWARAAGEDDGALATDAGPPRRRGGGLVLILVGALVAAVLVALVVVALLGAALRQAGSDRAVVGGVESLRLGTACPGDVTVLADPAMAAGTAEVAWDERWTVDAPRHAAQVSGGRLDVTTRCPGATVALGTVSDVTVRLAPGVATSVQAGVGDVAVRGTGADVRLSTGVGDVEVSDARGAVAVEAGTGDVTVAGALASVRVDGGTGDVVVSSTLAPDLVDVGVGVGDVTVRVPDDAAGYAVATDLGVGEAAVGVRQDEASPHRVSVDSGVGDVTLGDVALEPVP